MAFHQTIVKLVLIALTLNCALPDAAFAAKEERPEPVKSEITIEYTPAGHTDTPATPFAQQSAFNVPQAYAAQPMFEKGPRIDLGADSLEPHLKDRRPATERRDASGFPSAFNALPRQRKSPDSEFYVIKHEDDLAVLSTSGNTVASSVESQTRPRADAANMAIRSQRSGVRRDSFDPLMVVDVDYTLLPDSRTGDPSLYRECNYKGVPHPRFNQYPNNGVTICICDLGYTGSDCALDAKSFGPFKECSTDDDCEDGMVCDPQWVLRGNITQQRCGCPYNPANATFAGVEHPACKGEWPDIAGVRGIKCRYSGCGAGYRCAVFDDEVERDFGFCICAVNSTAPGCNCNGPTPDPASQNGNTTVLCKGSPEDSANCVPANSSYTGNACHTVPPTPPRRVPLAVGGCRPPAVWSYAMGCCLSSTRPSTSSKCSKYTWWRC